MIFVLAEDLTVVVAQLYCQLPFVEVAAEELEKRNLEAVRSNVKEQL